MPTPYRRSSMSTLKHDWEDRKQYRSKKKVAAVQLLADGVAEGTPFTLTTPAGKKLPAAIGGYLVEEDGEQRAMSREEFERDWEAEPAGVELTMGKRS
jgi:hypothetical protein